MSKKTKKLIYTGISSAIGTVIAGVAGLAFSLGGWGIPLAILGCVVGGILPTFVEHRFSKSLKPSSITILILEDDEKWLNKHTSRLETAGFKCYPTQYADDAIKVAKNNPSIQFGLIDYILYIPDSQDRQDIQGKGVVNNINHEKPDMKFIFITDLPVTEAGTDKNLDIYKQKINDLKALPGVIDIIDKEDLERDADDYYNRIITLIKRELNL